MTANRKFVGNPAEREVKAAKEYCPTQNKSQDTRNSPISVHNRKPDVGSDRCKTSRCIWACVRGILNFVPNSAGLC